MLPKVIISVYGLSERYEKANDGILVSDDNVMFLKERRNILDEDGRGFLYMYIITLCARTRICVPVLLQQPFSLQI